MIGITKTIDILKSLDKKILRRLIEILNVDYLVSDHDRILSSTMIEGWTSECDDYLRCNGYRGGKLTDDSKYFPSESFIYILYDKSQVSSDDITEYFIKVSQ